MEPADGALAEPTTRTTGLGTQILRAMAAMSRGFITRPLGKHGFGTTVKL